MPSKMLLRAKPLAMYNPLAETIVTCDASKIGIGGDYHSCKIMVNTKQFHFSLVQYKYLKKIVLLNWNY